MLSYYIYNIILSCNFIEKRYLTTRALEPALLVHMLATRPSSDPKKGCFKQRVQHYLSHSSNVNNYSHIMTDTIFYASFFGEA